MGLGEFAMAHEFTQPRAFLQPKFCGAQGYVSSATPLRWAIRQLGNRGWWSAWKKNDQRVQTLLYPGSYSTYETYGYLWYLLSNTAMAETPSLQEAPTENDDLGMDQYLLIPFLVGWTSIYQLFWCSPGVQGSDTLPFPFHLQIDSPVGCPCLIGPIGGKVVTPSYTSHPRDVMVEEQDSCWYIKS